METLAAWSEDSKRAGTYWALLLNSSSTYCVDMLTRSSARCMADLTRTFSFLTRQLEDISIFLRRELEQNITYYMSRCQEADVTAFKESLWSEAYDVRCLLWSHARNVRTRLWNWAFQLKYCLWYHARAVALAMMSRSNSSHRIPQNLEERCKSAMKMDTKVYHGAIQKESEARKEQNLQDSKRLTVANSAAVDPFDHLEPVPPVAPPAPPVARKAVQAKWFWFPWS